MALSDKVGDAFSQMTDRERKLVMLVGVVALLVFVAGIVYFGGNFMKAREARVQNARNTLVQIKSLESEYKASQKRDKASKSRLQKNPISFFSLLENTATDLGLKLNDLNERTTPVKDTNFSEVSVEVNFKQVSIDRLSAFMQKIEGDRSSGLVKVTKLKVKSRYDKADLLDVNMTVSTWKPAS